ncbi:MAG: ABC transporter ATP-binding protein [Chloroflexota bacterium]|nr:ABC transporter ATP-binding protein [Chloroflexota bacterium]
MNDTALLRLEDINKSFGPVHALKDVDLSLQAKELHGLVGGNGAGKTTLMNVLYGLYKPDSGSITLRGQSVDIHSPKNAIDYGIGMVHQHFLQVNEFTVAENVVLGTHLPNRPTMDLSAAEQQIRDLSDHFGLNVEPGARIEDLPMGIRQRVEILKALYRGVDLLILDEPTTHLTPQEVGHLFQSLKLMVGEGMSVVFITHKLREVMSVCHTISVLRDGQRIFTRPRDDVSEEMIVRSMVGADVALEKSLLFSAAVEADRGIAPNAQLILDVDGLRVDGEAGPLVDDLSLAVHAGEILGIAGVAGNGQQELLEAILGIRTAAAGSVQLDGQDISAGSTAGRLGLGIAYVPQDRQQDGFLPTANVAQNLILGSQRRPPYSNRRGFLNWSSIYETARDLIAEYSIRAQGPKETAANLSGGNIQRVMLARAFSRPLRLLIAHNPTSGLDIPSVESIYSRILEQKEQGVATLLVSEDMDELLLLSDRIAVVFRGKIAGILERAAFDRYEIGRLMSGVQADA